jgi:FixJ family two-component response regulator
MTKSENTPLNKNELEIVKLTLQGESQRSIAKQLDLSPSAVCRTLQRPHVVEKIKSSTQELLLQGRSHRFKSCNSYKGFSGI